MNEPIVDSWLVGVVSRDDALSGMRVHDGYVGAGPETSFANRMQVRLRYERTSPSGFPDEVQSEELLRIEGELVTVLGDAAVLVAVLTVPGFRDLVFHADPSFDCVQIVQTLGHDDVDVVDDPSWSAYRALFADAVDADADRRAVAQLAESRGEAAPVGRVEHGFAFEALEQADQAAAALRDAGLQVLFVAADDPDADAPPCFNVVDVETITQIEMARSRDALSGFAASWEGRYLGWRVVDVAVLEAEEQ